MIVFGYSIDVVLVRQAGRQATDGMNFIENHLLLLRIINHITFMLYCLAFIEFCLKLHLNVNRMLKD